MRKDMAVNTTVKIIVVVVIVAGTTAALLASNSIMVMDNPDYSGATVEQMAANQVSYKGFEVIQPRITVKKGTTVTWTNQDSAEHDVTPETETADFKASELFGKGETYKVTFTTPGIYNYYCSPHPYMKGVVEVTE